MIRGSTAREIATSAETAIRAGRFEAGDLLPTVRALAQSLGTSPATVNAGYQMLRQRGLVIGDGRRGTRVAPRPALRTPRRGHHGSDQTDAGRRDLTLGLPDPALLPVIAPALQRIDLEAALAIGEREATHPRLLEIAARSFAADGIPTGAITVTGGALDAIERVLQAHLRVGDRVVIEDPAYPPLRDILLALGLTPVPVAVDEQGLRPDALRSALARPADAVVVVPRAQNPFGSALDAARARELRGVLARRPGLLVVEDDHAGVISGARWVSLVDADRARWVVVRSVSKILHPDLRLALVAGDETTIARVEGRQALGPRWVSYVLQALVAELLADPVFPAIAQKARDAYAERRQALLRALRDQGLEAYGQSGLNVWIPVHEESAAVRALLEAGWVVLAGERFRVRTPPAVRITVATLQPGEAQEIAAVLGAAGRSSAPRRAY